MFGWTYAIFLAGVAAIAGPILAHLFNRTRYRRVPFTMLAFLQLSEKQTQSRRRLRELLVLLLRCVIILLIVMAFAGPILKRIIPLERSFDQHVLVLDNSLSMTRTHGNDEAWQQMLTAARDYLNKHDHPEKLFTLQTTQSGPIASLVPAQVAATQLGRLQPCSGDSQPQTLVAGLHQLRQQMGRDDRLFVHIISDFTERMCSSWLKSLSVTDVDGVTFDLITPHPETRNLAVTDVQILSLRDTTLALAATVTNQGLVSTKGVVQSQIGTQTSEQTLVDLSPGQQITYALNLDIKPYRHETCILIETAVTPDDDLSTDNTYRLALSLQEQPRQNVLLVGPSTSVFLIKTALETLSHYERGLALNLQCRDFGQLDDDAIQTADLLIFSHLDPMLTAHIQSLQERVSQGARLVVFQGPASATSTAERLYQQQLLPALPLQEIHKPSSLAPLDYGILPSWSTPQEQEMLAILQQYALDQTPLWHYSTCQLAAHSQGLWRISDQAHLVVWQPVESGRLIWINTSMDDSFSALTKGPAMPALSRWLLGMKQPFAVYAFSADEAVNVPTSCFGRIHDPQNVGFIQADGQRVAGRVTGTTVLCPGPHPLGWMRTLSDPVTYLGIHPLDDENRMSQPDPTLVQAQLQEAFHVTGTDDEPSLLTATTQEQVLGLEKWFLWLALALMLTDALITNRMQR